MNGPINDHKAVIASIGFAIGIIISLYICIPEHPSIFAASSSSVEIESKYPPVYIKINIIWRVNTGVISEIIEYIVKYAVIPANVGIVWISIIVIRETFLPLNLYLEYAYPVKEITTTVNIAVAIPMKSVLPIHFKYNVLLNK